MKIEEIFNDNNYSTDDDLKRFENSGEAQVFKKIKKIKR